MPCKVRNTGCARVLTLATVVIVMAGCASGLSREECQLADWRTIGYEDGMRGFPQTRISEHRKSCAEHGVALNLDAYRAGWDEGVRSFCQPGNGYRLGRGGNRYTGVCPADLEPAFIEAHAYGLEIYTLESEVNRLQRTINSKHSRVDHLEVAMRDAGIDLVTGEMTTEQRVVVLDELRKLQQEHSDTKAEIPYLEVELSDRRQELAAVIGQRQY